MSSTPLRRSAALAVSTLLLCSLFPFEATLAKGDASPIVRPAAQRSGEIGRRTRITPEQAALFAQQNPRPEAGPMFRLDGPRGRRPRAAHAASPTGLGGLRASVPAPSDPISTGVFAGIASNDQGGLIEPPDPWIAVSSTHIVQAVNSLVRISNRSGTALLSVPIWAFFALDPVEVDADPRVLWDAVHARWVGVLLSFVGDPSAGPLDAGFINLAVSETADPLGAWDIYWFSYTDTLGSPTLPDFPGLASTSDKIAVAVNEFQPEPVGYLGASLLVVTWSSILAGVDPATGTWTYADPSLWRIRPAQVLSASPDLHLVAAGASAHVMYQKVTGTGSGFSPGAWVDLTTAGGADAFGTPPAPKQPGTPATIADAVQHGPTDAAWRAGHLWFVATDAVSFDGGATFRDAVRVTELSTSSAVPGVVQTRFIATDGFDTFLGGVGVAGDGTAFVVYSESSRSQFATSKFVAYTPTYGWSPAVTIDDGDGTYAGARWGDYVGVAADPAGTAAVWQADEAAASDGTWRTTVSRLVFDLVPPTATAPTQAFVVPATLSGTVPLKLAWTGADAGSGIARYEVSQNLNGAGFDLLASAATTTSLNRAVFWSTSCPGGQTYQYRVRAMDGYGNAGAFATGPAFCPFLKQSGSGVVYSGAWGTASSLSYSGGSTRYSSTSNAKASFTFTGRNVAIVATRATTRGSFKVYLDGVYKATVSTYGTSTKFRQIVYQFGWLTAGTHTLAIVVSGTAGHPRVDVDALVYLK